MTTMFILNLDHDDGADDAFDKENLKTQQTPKDEAQVPLAVPPAASHSLELGGHDGNDAGDDDGSDCDDGDDPDGGGDAGDGDDGDDDCGDTADELK